MKSKMSIASNHATQRWEVGPTENSHHLSETMPPSVCSRDRAVDSKELGYLEGALEGTGVGSGG